MYTQCPECGTVFRVTAAVLRAAQAQVRCGVCDANFNALRFLTDELDGAPPASTAPAPTPPQAPAAAATRSTPSADEARAVEALERLSTAPGAPADEGDPPTDYNILEPEDVGELLLGPAAGDASANDDSRLEFDAPPADWAQFFVNASDAAPLDLSLGPTTADPGDADHETLLLEPEPEARFPETELDVVLVATEPDIEGALAAENPSHDEDGAREALADPADPDPASALTGLDDTGLPVGAATSGTESAAAAIPAPGPCEDLVGHAYPGAWCEAEPAAAADFKTAPSAAAAAPEDLVGHAYPGAWLEAEPVADAEPELAAPREDLAGHAYPTYVPAPPVASTMPVSEAEFDVDVDLGAVLGPSVDPTAEATSDPGIDFDSLAQTDEYPLPDFATDPALVAAVEGERSPVAEPTDLEYPVSFDDPGPAEAEHDAGLDAGNDAASAVADSAPSEEGPAEAATSTPAAGWADGDDFRRPEPPPTRSAPAAIAAAVLLGLLLLAQGVHHSRDALVDTPIIGPPLAALYGAFGAPVEPHWNLGSYEVRQWGAGSDGTAGTLRLRASIVNHAGRAQPYPLLRVVLEDRFGGAVARREFRPAEYLPSHTPPRGLLAAGARADADLHLVDPGAEVVGFELDVCLERHGVLSCGTDPRPPGG